MGDTTRLFSPQGSVRIATSYPGKETCTQYPLCATTITSDAEARLLKAAALILRYEAVPQQFSLVSTEAGSLRAAALNLGFGAVPQ